MWLEKSLALFQVATKRYTGRPQDLARVEAELEQGRHEWMVGRRELVTIETSDAWDYPDWWPRLSGQIETPIALPQHIYSAQGKRTAIEALHKVFKNIEIVSVVLRFMCPDAFGIISPPVTSFLCLFPPPNAVEQYLIYLKVLEDFRKHCSSENLKRVADIDMALWSATHLVRDPAYAFLAEEIRNDEYLQETRISNLANGLGSFWQRSGLQRIVFARSMLPHDYGLSGLVAARIYESALRDMGERLGICNATSPATNKALVLELESRTEVGRLGLKPGELTKLWEWRNDAVHANLNFTKDKAAVFVNRVERLWRALRDWKP